MRGVGKTGLHTLSNGGSCRHSGKPWHVVALFALTLALWVAAGFARADTPANFSQGKRAARAAHPPGTRTLYCGCLYDAGWRIIPESCGFSPERETVRSWRVEWEHVVPASKLGEGRACWEERDRFAQCVGKSRRECCRLVDPEFARAEGDPLNLRPAVGELNAARGNRPMGEVEGEARRWGSCDFETSRAAVEPPPASRREIALIHLVMGNRYGLTWPPDQFAMLLDWLSDEP